MRECIQNVLDARLPDEPQVRVSFKFMEQPRSTVASLFKGLLPHLQSDDNGLEIAFDTLPDPMRFLVIEDSGTTGLAGDVEEFTLDADSDNAFFYFWRNTGRSGKSDDSRGRWGLGKAVFPATSQIHTFFGLTKRLADMNTVYLMGQSILNNHRFGGDGYQPYGYFGRFGDSEEFFALPVTQPAHINPIIEQFDLIRADETGLSLLIAMPYPEITMPLIVVAVAEQYFYPILDGRLVVQAGPWQIDRKNLAHILDALPPPDDDDTDTPRHTISPATFRRTLDFTQWAMTLDDADYVQFPPPDDLEAAPFWRHYLPTLSDDEQTRIRQQFADTGRMAFHVPVKVQRTDGEPELSGFRVYLERDDKLSRAENYFIREGITITGLRTLAQRDMRGMVVVDETPLTTMLGDAENPAHTEWQKDSQNFKGKYEHGYSTIDFVKYSLRDLARFLTEVERDVDPDLLQDMFYLETPYQDDPPREKPQPTNKPSEPEGESPQPPAIPPIQSDSPVQLIQYETGLSVRPNRQSERTVTAIHLKLAYDTRRGNAFASYVPFDFDLGDLESTIQIETSGCEITHREANQLSLNVTDAATYRVDVSGFDRYRDLVVRLKWKGASET